MDKKTNIYGYNSTFPTLLRSLMENHKKTQEEVAQFCGVQRQTISQWKNGNTRPDIADLENLAELFHVSADYLLGLPDRQDILKEFSDKKEGFVIQWLLNDYRMHEKQGGITEKSLLSLLGEFFQIAGYDPACPDLVFRLEDDGHLQMKTYNCASPQAERNIETHIKGINREYSFTEFILQQLIYDIDKALHSRAQHAALVLEYARKSPVEVKYITQKEDHDEKS